MSKSKRNEQLTHIQGLRDARKIRMTEDEIEIYKKKIQATSLFSILLIKSRASKYLYYYFIQLSRHIVLFH
jgi:hypothetical protein